MEITVQLPLRDFYNGVETEIEVERQTICETCEGSGSADGEVETCSQCGGRGMVIQKHMLAPGIFQQVQSVCGACSGKGQTIRHPCKTCGGSRVVRKGSIHPLHVERGMATGTRLNYENEADESPDWVAGDLIVHLLEKQPVLGSTDEEKTDGTFFHRKADDLYWTEVLSLREAWMGDWTRNITHLDGHVVQLSRSRGQVVQPATVEIIQDEGMPIWRSGTPEQTDSAYGALHVEYVVVLPDQMDRAMEKDFWNTWQKWRTAKSVIDLDKDSGRPSHNSNNVHHTADGKGKGKGGKDEL